MLKHTQTTAQLAQSGVDPSSGVSCPRFQQIAFAFGIHAASVYSWDDFQQAIPAFLAYDGPALIEYHMHPKQIIGPKLGYHMEDGVAVYDKFAQMSPNLESENAH
jgi:thiamine pyrophosphate-dependent acetolactate synthase large subunit-like protein